MAPFSRCARAGRFRSILPRFFPSLSVLSFLFASPHRLLLLHSFSAACSRPLLLLLLLFLVLIYLPLLVPSSSSNMQSFVQVKLRLPPYEVRPPPGSRVRKTRTPTFLARTGFSMGRRRWLPSGFARRTVTTSDSAAASVSCAFCSSFESPAAFRRSSICPRFATWGWRLRWGVEICSYLAPRSELRHIMSLGSRSGRGIPP